MPWVHRHRRRVPYSWFRTTTVRSHYRRPADFPVIAITVVVVVLLFALALLL